MESLRIIVADDNPTTLQWLVSLLGRQFDIVATAENGRQALESIRCHRPDVVVLDLALPLLNGFEIIRELRTCAPSPAVVICSVETDPEIVEAAREAGALRLNCRGKIGSGWSGLYLCVVRAFDSPETAGRRPIRHCHQSVLSFTHPKQAALVVLPVVGLSSSI